MPANLPPDYFRVEKEYRAASSAEAKIACLEEMLRIMPKHKGTDKLRGGLRKRLSKLKSAPQSKKGASKRESAFYIDRAGAGQAVIVGAPNVGKSALLVALTNATPEVADFPYTTWQPTPGMMSVENVQIQLIDTPPLTSDYVEPELVNLIKRADLILLVVNLQTDPIQQLEDTVALLQERRIVPRHLQDRYAEEQGATITPFLILVNKNDDEHSDEDFEIFCELIEGDWSMLPISVRTGRNLDRLRWAVFEQLDIMRVYSKTPGQEPDFSSPFTMEKGNTVEDFAGRVHKDFLEKLTSARVWGEGVFDGQMVGRDHVLHDSDIVELHM